ncbi:MAG: hypothetical protein FRX48_07219 [Lasallia pustulata]|uniref:F-box domain-containing protein n=1 Tax=Lasallia pustulata TaxID=136370 RepID=A0A5M8PHS7_9LECA|nr:MAG: hypothetical protein FRX48_07219 [Lasallia pustulata]
MAHTSGGRGEPISPRSLLARVLRRNLSFPNQTGSRGSQHHEVTSESAGEEMESDERTSDQQVRTRSSTIPTGSFGCKVEDIEAADSASLPSKLNFLDLFLGLPGELQCGILCEMTSHDVFALRATCRAFHEVIVIQASPIVRHLVKKSILAEHLGDYIGLYPLPEPTSEVNLDYLYQLSHRLHVVDKLSMHMANFIIKKVFHFYNNTAAFNSVKQTYIDNMVYNMRPVLFVLFHFFESYRAALVRSASERILRGAVAPPGLEPCCARKESDIIRKYADPAKLWRAHNIYRFLSMVLSRKLRPPSYVGNLESRLRGWGKKPATKESIVQLIILGGLKEVNNVLDSRSYGARLNTLQKYLSRTLLPAQQMPAKGQHSPQLGQQGESRLGRETLPANVSVSPRDPRYSSPCLALHKISSVMPQLDTQTAFEVSRFLPEHDSMWRTAAESQMRALGIIQRREDLPHLFYFIGPFILADVPGTSENEEDS